MTDPVVAIAAVLLAATFAWAALAKIVRYEAWSDALARYPLRGAIRAVARPAVPPAEIAVVALTLLRPKAGAALAVALLAAFSLVLVRAAAEGDDRLPCGCFGGAATRDYRLMLLRNGFLAILAAIVLVAPGEIALGGFWRPPRGFEVVPALLVAAGLLGMAAVAWSVARATRRPGR